MDIVIDIIPWGNGTKATKFVQKLFTTLIYTLLFS